MSKDPRKLMEEGWKARENLEFEKAKDLLYQAKKLFEKSEDWFNVTETLNHLAYTEKLKSVHSNIKGLELAKKAEEVAEKYSTKKVLVLRALMSLASSAGLYEQALKWGHKCLEEFSSPMPRADILSHIALFQLRTGNLDESEKTIHEAESLIENHFEEEQEPHRSIWKYKVMYTKGLILYNKGNSEEARRYMLQALDIAEKQNLKTRAAEVKTMLELF